MTTWSDVQHGVSVLMGAPAQLRALREEYQQKRAEHTQNPDWSERYREQQLASLRERTEAAFLQAREQVAAAREAIADWRSPVASSVEAQILAEQREARAWTRAERMLSTGVAAQALIDQAVTGGDVDTLRALKAELPSYLGSQLAGRTLEERQVATVDAGRAIDLALAKALPDGGEKQALRARLRVEALAPIAEQELAFTSSVLLGQNASFSNLQHAIQIEYLKSDAAPVLEALDGPSGQEGGAA